MEGQRVPVLLSEGGLTEDEGLANIPVILPPPTEKLDWPQPGGGATKSNGHIAVSEALDEAWSVSIGDGGSDDQALLAQPVLVDGRIFALDSEAQLTALDAQSGRRLWERDLQLDEEDEALYAGGVTTGGGRVYVATGFGEVFALDPATGETIWRERLLAPVRSRRLCR